MSNFEKKSLIEKSKDVPYKSDKVNLGEYSITPDAYRHLTNNLHIDPWKNREVRLFLSNQAEDLGRQLTLQDLKDNESKIKDILVEEEKQREMIDSLPENHGRDKVIEIQVVHEPNLGLSPANLKIRALTEKGLRITLKVLSGGLDFERNLNKKDMAKDFFSALVGKEIDFFKQKINSREPGKERMELRAMPKRLPKDFGELTYPKLLSWYKKREK